MRSMVEGLFGTANMMRPWKRRASRIPSTALRAVPLPSKLRGGSRNSLTHLRTGRARADMLYRAPSHREGTDE